MHFNMPNLMILGALLASFVLLFRSGERIPAFIALIAAALEALIAFRLVSFKGPQHLGLILAAALTVGGAWAWVRAVSKPAVAAATVIALIGIIQLLVALKVLA
ncbi:MAG TPA: hypothetical protein VKB80_34275 [Kofleriaceae bacterium]|nr:hypothetical protein [Kofleriaceae bacterium]